MFVVRRPFRDAKGVMLAGTVVKPADLQRFMFRVKAGHLVEVNEQNFKAMAAFFKQRYNVDLPVIAVAKPVAKPAKPVETKAKETKAK